MCLPLASDGDRKVKYAVELSPKEVLKLFISLLTASPLSFSWFHSGLVHGIVLVLVLVIMRSQALLTLTSSH